MWLILLAFVHSGLAFGLYEDIDDYYLWPRGKPSEETPSINKECIRDILVILDTSQSIGFGNFTINVQPFLRDLIDDPRLKVGRAGSHFGLITFSSWGKTKVHFRIESRDKADLLKKVDKLNYDYLSDDTTYTGRAFELASDNVFRENSPLNHRETIKDVVLLFTDGQPNGANGDTKEQKNLAKKYSGALMERNVTIVALAIGPQGKKEAFQKQILSWSNYMFISGFDDLDSFVENIVDKTCFDNSAARCRCKSNITSLVYLKPGEKTISLPWEEPELDCEVNDVEKTVSPPGTQNSQDFKSGEHKIKYKFTYSNKGKQVGSTECQVVIEVSDACQCPRTQTVRARVDVGKEKALVRWTEPKPKGCPIKENRYNPGTTGEYSGGNHKVVYVYETEIEGQPSFEIRCHVNIVVTGDFCGKTAYNPATHVCCDGTRYPKRSGYRCCGKKYYHPFKKICCRDTSLVSVGEYCPKYCP